MKNFSLEEIKLISEREQRANSFVFNDGLNVITGQNGVGKSHLIKSIPWVFGAEPSTMHPNWIKADISVIVTFSVDKVRYKILRTGNTYLVFNNQDKLINHSQSVTKELSPFLADLFDFRLELPLKDTNELTQLPPAFYLSPFYVDQDSGWVNLWQSFTRLQMFANWRRPLIDALTGILSSELQTLKNDLRKARFDLNTAQKQEVLFKETFESVRGDISNADFDIDFQEYKEEINNLVQNLEVLQKQEFEYKESIRKISNRKSVLDSQVLIIKSSTESLNKEHKTANDINGAVVECPTCGSIHENSFVEKFNIAQDLYRAQELWIDLNEELGATVRELDKIQALSIANAKEIERVNDILNKKSHKVTVNELIKKEGEKHLRVFLREKADSLAIRIAEFLSKVTELEKKERDLVKQTKEQKKKVESFFIDSMKTSLEYLNVKNLMMDDFKDIYSGSLPEAGSDKPRAFLAHVFSLIKTIEQFYNSPIPPIIIDSPNQQDQDPANVDRIYNFIVNERPQNHQMILGLANGESRDFGECNKIILKEENYILQKEKYNDVQAEFTRLLGLSLK